MHDGIISFTLRLGTGRQDVTEALAHFQALDFKKIGERQK